ncbi:hypothetical protein Tco_0615246 [Tanacetum coccineum]
MRELREDTFFENKNDNAHEHVERVLDIVSLFNIPGVSHDAVMLRVFPITLTRAAKIWVGRLSPGTVDSWDLFKKSFIQRYFPPSKTAKQLKKIRNFKQEEAAKRHVKQDEWLKKFYQNTETNPEAPDKIIQGLKTKVRTLTNEVKGRANDGKFEECKANCIEDGSLLYTPFNYSPKEIEYFFTNSGFSYNERQETDKSGMTKSLAALEATHEIKKVPREEKQSVNYYVDPHEPPIPFPRRLEHHTEEALVHKTMESLKKIKINRPLLKEIRQTDNYAKHMKDLVANKPRTEEDEEIRMNPRLDFNNALADLGASISVMPLSMYKRLGIGKLEPINMVIEMADNTKCTPKGIVENLLIKIDKFIFPVDFVILDMVEDFRMPIILGRPLLATAHAKESYEEAVYRITKVDKETYPTPKEKRVHWLTYAMEEVYQLTKRNVIGKAKMTVNGRIWKREELSLNDWMKIRYGKVCKMTTERILKDHWREKFGEEEDDIEENSKDPEKCG